MWFSFTVFLILWAISFTYFEHSWFQSTYSFIFCSLLKIRSWEISHAIIIWLDIWVYLVWSLMNFLLQNLCPVVPSSGRLRVCISWLSWEMASFSYMVLCMLSNLVLYPKCFEYYVMRLWLLLKSFRKAWSFCFGRWSTQSSSYHTLCLSFGDWWSQCPVSLQSLRWDVRVCPGH